MNDSKIRTIDISKTGPREGAIVSVALEAIERGEYVFAIERLAKADRSKEDSIKFDGEHPRDLSRSDPQGPMSERSGETL